MQISTKMQPPTPRKEKYIINLMDNYFTEGMITHDHLNAVVESEFRCGCHMSPLGISPKYMVESIQYKVAERLAAFVHSLPQQSVPFSGPSYPAEWGGTPGWIKPELCVTRTKSCHVE